jgi:hypothetical protein
MKAIKSAQEMDSESGLDLLRVSQKTKTAEPPKRTSKKQLAIRENVLGSPVNKITPYIFSILPGLNIKHGI